MSGPQTFQLGAVRCSTSTIPELVEQMKQLLTDQTLSPRSCLCINAHIYNLAAQHPELASWINAARIVAADGMAIVWAAPLFGVRLRGRCNMTEAFRAFLEDSTVPPNTAILVGCSPEEAAVSAQTAMRHSTHCRIVQTFSGYLGEEQYRKIFSEHREVDFIFLGMGTPKTEQVAALAAAIAPRAIVWGIGGGTIRIFAGTLKEAPALFRRLGLQWVYRLLEEPGKLWKRYLIGNPLFFLRIIREAACFKGKRISER